MIKKILVSFKPLIYGFLLYIIGNKVILIFTIPQKEEQLQKNDCKNSQICDITFILSKREIEVAKLASKGMTNLQIADELFISPETVKRHLATVYTKTGINSRHELIKILYF